MHIDLTADELNYVRAALTLVIVEREELIETGRFAKELGEDSVAQPTHESAEYEEKLGALLAKLTSVEDTR
jgi:hypothetical protein